MIHKSSPKLIGIFTIVVGILLFLIVLVVSQYEEIIVHEVRASIEVFYVLVGLSVIAIGGISNIYLWRNYRIVTPFNYVILLIGIVMILGTVLIPIGNVTICGNVMDKITGEKVANSTYLVKRQYFAIDNFENSSDQEGYLCFDLPYYAVLSYYSFYSSNERHHFNLQSKNYDSSIFSNS